MNHLVSPKSCPKPTDLSPMGRGKHIDVDQAIAETRIAFENAQASINPTVPDTPTLVALRRAMEQDHALSTLMVDVLHGLTTQTRSHTHHVESIHQQILRLLK